VSDSAVPLPIPDVAPALEEAHARRRAAGQQLFQFLIERLSRASWNLRWRSPA
jgi:hypothetical protein